MNTLREDVCYTGLFLLSEILVVRPLHLGALGEQLKQPNHHLASRSGAPHMAARAPLCKVVLQWKTMCLCCRQEVLTVMCRHPAAHHLPHQCLRTIRYVSICLLVDTLFTTLHGIRTQCTYLYCRIWCLK